MTKTLIGRPFLVLLVAALWLVALLMAPAMPTMMLPDSALYLEWASIVPLGYPAFASLFRGWWLIFAQITLYSGAVMLFALVVRDLRYGKWVSPILVLALFVNPQTDAMLSSVLSEGLFLPLNVLMLALAVVFSSGGSYRIALGAAVVAGLCAAVRPASMPLGFVVALACVLRWEGRSFRQRLLLAAGCLTLWATVIVIERLASQQVQTGESTSLAGPHLLGKASLLDVPKPFSGTTSPRERLIAATMENDFGPARKFLKEQSGSLAYPPLLAFYEVCFQHQCSANMRAKLKLPPAEANTVIAHVAWLRIKQNPLEYLWVTLDEYRSLWVFGVRSHPVLGPRYDTQIARLQPLPLRDKVATGVASPVPTSRATLIIRPAFIAMGVAVALLCGLLAYSSINGAPSRQVLPSLLAAVATEAIMVFTAIAGIGEGRYTMGLWPNIASALVLSIIALGDWRALLFRTRDV